MIYLYGNLVVHEARPEDDGGLGHVDPALQQKINIQTRVENPTNIHF
jgi:hypothetical protein